MTQLSSRWEDSFGALKQLISSGSRVAFVLPFHCPPPEWQTALRMSSGATTGNILVVGARDPPIPYQLFAIIKLTISPFLTPQARVCV